ncbi:MAG TPA: cytochrome c maturation protein CcmE [Kofleriaceae bacterium]
MARTGSMLYFAIRVAVGSSIMIAFYLTRGFGSKLETFVMAFAAALASQGVAFAVKLAVGDQPRSKRSAALLGACVIAIAASVVFIAVDKQRLDQHTRVRGYLDLSTLKRSGDTAEFTIVDAGKRTTIRYRGVLSDQVRDRNEIIATGQWHGGVFVATDVLAKCPTSYPSPNGPVPAATYR